MPEREVLLDQKVAVDGRGEGGLVRVRHVELEQKAGLVLLLGLVQDVAVALAAHVVGTARARALRLERVLLPWRGVGGGVLLAVGREKAAELLDVENTIPGLPCRLI